MKKVLRKVTAFVMALVMCLSMTNVCVYAEETVMVQDDGMKSNQSGWDGVSTVNSYKGENYTVTFMLESYWDGGYNANVKIENIGDIVIESWCLSFGLNNNIVNIWNAEIVSNEAGKCIIKNAGWNADIPVGGSVEFGISVNESFGGFPSTYEMVGKSTQVKEEEYSVKYIIDSEWESDFNARLLLTNNAEDVLEDWVIEFDYDREITSIWNGEIVRRVDNHYVIRNVGYNANIAVGETVSIGFNGADGKKEDAPFNYVVYSYRYVDNKDEEDGEQIVNIDGGISWDEMQDTDSDGLPDVYEKENMLNPENPDTDGDGLLDGFEVMKASSNPLNKYTLENGVIDADLDPDGDGLTLLAEQLNDTDPLEGDTDGDGILDGDEVNKYKTNPIIFDTDSDEVCDGVEIEIGLDPLNPQTYGYPDKDYKYTIKIDSSSDKLSRINTDNEDYLMDVEIEGNGDVYSGLLVRNSAYYYSLQSEFSLGAMPEIMYMGEGVVESVKVSFKISEKNIHDTFSSKDLRGVKRYSIFYFDEENGVVVPLSTEVDEKNNVISAISSNVGTFIVVDMEEWLTTLGFEIADEQNESQVEGLSTQMFNLRGAMYDYSVTSDDGDEEVGGSVYEMDSRITAASSVEKEDGNADADNKINLERGLFSLKRSAPVNVMTSSEDDTVVPETVEPGVTPVDLVFCFNSKAGDISATEFESIKQNILITGKIIFQNCRMARIYIIDQHGNIVKTNIGSNYATYENALISMLEIMDNTSFQENNMGKLLQTLTNDIPFRADAYRGMVFLGDNYLPSYSDDWRQTVVNEGAKCIINCPSTQSGSWYDKLSKETNGLLLYNYLEFSDDIIKFMFGDAAIKGLTTYNMISSVGLKKIVLKGQLNSHSNIDTDEDSLCDWAEIRTDRIKVNPGGGAILPTYYEYLSKYSSVELLKWKSQYKNLYDRNGKTIQDMLNEVLVLPVLSDPTMKDSDGDGILDNVEKNHKKVDQRYACIGPLHTDTVETIYPELSDSKINDPSYPSYITVNGNDVVVHLNVVFKGDTAVKANTVLNTSVTDANIVNEVNNITARLGADPTLKELVIDGIKSRWNSSFTGNEYDFCEGLAVNFSVEINEIEAEAFKNEIHVTIKSGVCGRSHQSGVNWKTKCNRKITLYTSCCDEDSHEGKAGSSCSNYTGRLYHIAQFEGTAAHEMGHGMGLQDLYASAVVNHDYTIISNSEIVYSTSYFALPAAGVIMNYNGRGTENDIEMLILAFCENEWQYYVPYGKNQKMSKAIKSDVTFSNTNNPGVVYVWDEATHSFK